MKTQQLLLTLALTLGLGSSFSPAAAMHGAAAAVEAVPLFPAEDPTKPTVVYAHGFCGNQLRILYHIKDSERIIDRLIPYASHRLYPKKDHYVFTLPEHNIVTFNFPDVHVDAGIFGSLANFRTTPIGQSEDVEALLARLQGATSPRKIGFGVSRGSATWLSLLGQKPDIKLDALVLECPFASMQETAPYDFLRGTIKFFNRRLSDAEVAVRAANLFKKIVPNHDPTGVQPITNLHAINKETPILLIHSRADRVIPYRNTRMLARAFAANGFSHVYYLELPTGPHGKLLWHDEVGERYRDAIHAFFAKYNLPHTAAFAARADINLYNVNGLDLHEEAEEGAVVVGAA